MRQRIVKFSILEERESQIIVGRRSVWSHFDGILEIIDGCLKLAQSPQSYTFVEECLIPVLLFLKARAARVEGFLVVIHSLFNFIPSGLDESSIKEVLTLRIQVKSFVVMSVSLIKLGKRVMLISSHVCKDHVKLVTSNK